MTTSTNTRADPHRRAWWQGAVVYEIYPRSFANADGDGGYDVTDLCQVDPAYGTLEDFDHLVAQAHRRGLRVIVDWVPNHTSDRHPWFVEARASRDAPRRDWYVWGDGRDDQPPNNWLSAFDDVGPAGSYDNVTGQWYLHSTSQPKSASSPTRSAGCRCCPAIRS